MKENNIGDLVKDASIMPGNDAYLLMPVPLENNKFGYLIMPLSYCADGQCGMPANGQSSMKSAGMPYGNTLPYGAGFPEDLEKITMPYGMQPGKGRVRTYGGMSRGMTMPYGMGSRPMTQYGRGQVGQKAKRGGQPYKAYAKPKYQR